MAAADRVLDGAEGEVEDDVGGARSADAVSDGDDEDSLGDLFGDSGGASENAVGDLIREESEEPELFGDDDFESVADAEAAPEAAAPAAPASTDL